MTEHPHSIVVSDEHRRGLILIDAIVEFNASYDNLLKTFQDDSDFDGDQLMNCLHYCLGATSETWGLSPLWVKTAWSECRRSRLFYEESCETDPERLYKHTFRMVGLTDRKRAPTHPVVVNSNGLFENRLEEE